MASRIPKRVEIKQLSGYREKSRTCRTERVDGRRIDQSLEGVAPCGQVQAGRASWEPRETGSPLGSADANEIEVARRRCGPAHRRGTPHSSDGLSGACDQPKTVTAFPVVASSYHDRVVQDGRFPSTDVLRTKTSLTPVSGYNWVKTLSARRTDLQRNGGVNIDGGSGISGGPKNKVVGSPGRRSIAAAALQCGGHSQLI